MKIAIVLNTSWNIYNFRMGLVKALLKEGHEVVTVAPEDEFSPLLVEAGCQYEKVTMDSRGASPLKDFGLLLELRRIYKRTAPDVVLHFTIKPNIYGTVAAATLGIPSINNVSGLGTVFLKDNLVNRIAIGLYRAVFRLPKLVFFQNKHDLNLFLEKRLVKKQITGLLPGSGIALDHFIPSKFELHKPFTFLMISRLIYDKGVLEYVEAAKKLRAKGLKARFQLLGAKDPKHKRGISTEQIDQWIAEGDIEYLGTSKDVRENINKSDCVVLPSYREGTPRTLLEAASLCKPIVATDVPGCTNVVTDNVNGFLCKAKDAHDLASKMEMMLKAETEQISEMGENGRRIVEERFDERIVIEKYLAAVEKQALVAGNLAVSEY
ncbi:glycosyltransferase family 4 protein [Roseivirga sp. BDSF3-8]|uniref:glycosyltransferase family 4 protein n=1 Tax=Roseivirga sp. BDSF3-8 TaxID=3241598 RepID=UPI003531AE3E